ncbi:MAG: DUF992 domain-containing protein [Methylobacterium sp.]|uniref:DUF992 domain-containing protein n=1 Tax=Methylobacterium sp. TaxID=409 RepID=UPI002590BA24|nr:DUF992 domain-containing protein [Methylobacterium sp.]MBY0299230.1 DUF992 domain-containing protein [Methylobacterium sp.]
MRTITIALSSGLLAAAATLALAGTEARPLRPAGTLTCITNPHVGLVFGTTRAASCLLVSEGGDLRQDLGALLPGAGRDRDVTRSETLSWRVLTADGSLRAGQVDGVFAGEASATVPVFQAEGRPVRLEPLPSAAAEDLNFSGPAPRLLLATPERTIGEVTAAGRF